MSLADGADLMFTGLPFEQPASNIAEYHDIPLVTLHYFPARANGHLVPGVPVALIRSFMTMVWWLVGLLMKRLDDRQRGELGLPSATGRPSRQPAVDSVTETVAMIAAACEQLGERALVCATWGDLSDVPHFEHVKVVPVVNFAATFPACRAVVHHGGAGTTAAGLRAGVPTAILWTLPDQPIWGAQLKRQGLGTVRRLSSATQQTLVADLRTILAPEYASRARRFASRMSKPADSVTNAADLLESLAQVRRVA
ncbi:MAG: hypothetical protein B7X07_06840 [Actinobacteria bacterium 21-64-8]|nr:MAG: hypothetical protein B7X07_06840 [Actinobacteria bacterium 21-64-8]